MKVVKQEYYFSRPKIASLYSPNSKYKSISHYSDRSLVQNLDMQMKINETLSEIQYLKGRINYEKNQLQQLYLLSSDANLSFSQIPLSKLDPETYYMKQNIVKLKEQLKRLELEEHNLVNMNFHKINQNEEYAYKDYMGTVINRKTKNQLLQRKEELLEGIKQKRHEIYLDQMEITLQDNQIIELGQKIRIFKQKLQHESEKLLKVQEDAKKVEFIDLKKSRHVKDFMSKLGVGNQQSDDLDQVIESYNKKISNNKKTIEEFLLISQQRTYYALTQIQDLEYEIQQQKKAKQQLQQQISEVKLKIQKFSKTTQTSLENNYQNDNQNHEQMSLSWLSHSMDLKQQEDTDIVNES